MNNTTATATLKQLKRIEAKYKAKLRKEAKVIDAKWAARLRIDLLANKLAHVQKFRSRDVGGLSVEVERFLNEDFAQWQRSLTLTHPVTSQDVHGTLAPEGATYPNK